MFGHSSGVLAAHRRGLHATVARAAWPGPREIGAVNMHVVDVVARFQTTLPLAVVMIT